MPYSRSRRRRESRQTSTTSNGSPSPSIGRQKRVQDGDTVWRYDARLTLALELLEPTADRALPANATPYSVRVWKYEKSERACTTIEIGRNQPFVGEPMEGTATLLITKRNDTEVEGAITLHDASGADAKLSFHAPLVVTLEKDPTFCCMASLGGGG